MRSRIPPPTVAAPNIAGVPATGIFGVGVAVTTWTISWAGVAVTIILCTICPDVGVGVAGAAGQLQVDSPVQLEFLQRFTPWTVAQMRPPSQSESLPQDASQGPGWLGGLVGGIGVLVGGIGVLVGGIGVLVGGIGVGEWAVPEQEQVHFPILKAPPPPP